MGLATITRRPKHILAIAAGVPIAALLLAIVLLIVLSGGKSKPPRGAAIPAQNVIGSIGVNVHLSYLDTAYARWPGIEAKLKGLGVRNIRDGACPGCVQENQRLTQLGKAGFGIDLIMGDPKGTTGKLQQLIGNANQLAPYLTSLEGPNEYDNQGDPQWAAHLTAYQQQLYKAVKGDKQLKNKPVIGPSFVNPESYLKVQKLNRSMDAANLHSYPPNGGPPASNLDGELRRAALFAPRKPAFATETGYRTGGPKQPGNLPVNPKVEAGFMTALVLEYYRAGIPRSYLYELVDERPDQKGTNAQEHFGLLNNNLKPKPAYHALHNLIAILRAGGPARGQMEQPEGTVTTLDGAPIHTLTMQRGDGSQVLAVWLTNPDGRFHTAELNLDQSAPVQIYRPSLGARAQATLPPSTDDNIKLGREPVLVVIPPSA
ncbi:MAG TPA: hypothetical protein VGF74_09650 [Thermoleophilaceae bacterium]